MPVSNSPIFPQLIRTPGVSIAPGDTTTRKSLLAGGANGTRVDAISIASTDTASRDVALWLYDGSTHRLLTTVTVPASSGNNNATPAIDVLRSTQIPGLPYDAAGNRILYVASGCTLEVSCTSTVTTACTIDVTIPAAGDY